MKYYCPNCKTIMEGIYCECVSENTPIISYHLHWIDGKLTHSCGKPLHPDIEKEFLTNLTKRKGG